MEEEKTNWELIKEVDWIQVKKDMLENAPNSFDKANNKEKLLSLILELTGIEFTEIEMAL